MKTAFYDFTQAPYSFDFATFLVCAKSHGCERIVLVPGKRMIKLPDGRELEFQKCTEEEQAQRLSSIILSLAPEAIICKTRDAARAYWMPDCYPHGYTIDMPKSGHMLKDVLRFSPVAQLTANPELVKHIRTRFPARFALINIRESNIKPERNSNFDAWRIAATWLRNNGIEPLFIPDSAHLDRDWTPFLVSKIAATSAAYRLALMACAEVTLGISHGPMGMAIFSPYPLLLFRLVDERNWETSSNFWNLMGVPIGAQLPWFSERQRYIWQTDDAENIIRQLKRLFHVKQAA